MESYKIRSVATDDVVGLLIKDGDEYRAELYDLEWRGWDAIPLACILSGRFEVDGVVYVDDYLTKRMLELRMISRFNDMTTAVLHECDIPKWDLWDITLRMNGRFFSSDMYFDIPNNPYVKENNNV